MPTLMDYLTNREPWIKYSLPGEDRPYLQWPGFADFPPSRLGKLSTALRRAVLPGTIATAPDTGPAPGLPRVRNFNPPNAQPWTPQGWDRPPLPMQTEQWRPPAAPAPVAAATPAMEPPSSDYTNLREVLGIAPASGTVPVDVADRWQRGGKGYISPAVQDRAQAIANRARATVEATPEYQQGQARLGLLGQNTAALRNYRLRKQGVADPDLAAGMDRGTLGALAGRGNDWAKVELWRRIHGEEAARQSQQEAADQTAHETATARAAELLPKYRNLPTDNTLRAQMSLEPLTPTAPNSLELRQAMRQRLAAQEAARRPLVTARAQFRDFAAGRGPVYLPMGQGGGLMDLMLGGPEYAAENARTRMWQGQLGAQNQLAQQNLRQQMDIARGGWQSAEKQAEITARGREEGRPLALAATAAANAYAEAKARGTPEAEALRAGETARNLVLGGIPSQGSGQPTPEAIPSLAAPPPRTAEGTTAGNPIWKLTPEQQEKVRGFATSDNTIAASAYIRTLPLPPSDQEALLQLVAGGKPRTMSNPSPLPWWLLYGVPPLAPLGEILRKTQ